MAEDPSAIDSIRTSYDRVADAYAEAIFDELKEKPFDREQLARFAAATAGGRDYSPLPRCHRHRVDQRRAGAREDVHRHRRTAAPDDVTTRIRRASHDRQRA